MFPYHDSVARRYPPVIVWAVIGMNVLAFLYQISLPPRVLDRFLFEFALVPSRFFGELSLVAPSDWTPFLTNIFLHGGWLHLILNMWTLWIFGPAVEDRLGPSRFTLFYLFCGVAAGLAHALANPHSVVPALGASGAIAGVIGCYARMFPAATGQSGETPNGSEWRQPMKAKQTQGSQTNDPPTIERSFSVIRTGCFSPASAICCFKTSHEGSRRS